MNKEEFQKQCSLFLLLGGGEGEDDSSSTFVEGEAAPVLPVNTAFRKLPWWEEFPTHC